MTAALIAPTAIFLVVPDLVLHAHRSTVTRYDMVLYIGLLTSVAGCLSQGISSRTRAFAWSTGAALLFCVSLGSSIVDAHARVWWDNHEDGPNPTIALTIDRSLHPLVVVRNSWPRLLALSYYLNDGVSIQAMKVAQLPAAQFKSTFVFGRVSDARAFEAILGASSLRSVYAKAEGNAQLRRFRGTSTAPDSDSMLLWQIVAPHYGATALTGSSSPGPFPAPR
jgi:hypothetical protein